MNNKKKNVGPKFKCNHLNLIPIKLYPNNNWKFNWSISYEKEIISLTFLFVSFIFIVLIYVLVNHTVYLSIWDCMRAAVFKIVRTYLLLTVSTRSYAVLVVICRRIRVQQDALSDRWVQRWQWGHSSFPGRTSPMIEQFRYRRTEIEPINKAFC